ncbi:MAG: hypothetical protein HDR09_20075 [Lachnospiraceae bacterium]|nr:hypothetical protein [Lachnospiraceae bacterium]MBD5505973.1 hypothetical protein [Lachnospiraceae bacterium]
MKAKFEEFNDGIVDVYDVNDEDRLEKAKTGLRYGNETVGVTRHYAARAADTRVDRVIHILRQQDIKPHQVAVIEGEQYDIDKTDHMQDTLPPITRLTLIEFEKHRKKEFENEYGQSVDSAGNAGERTV